MGVLGHIDKVSPAKLLSRDVASASDTVDEVRRHNSGLARYVNDMRASNYERRLDPGMTSIILVNMPFADWNRPSFALSQLAALTRRELGTQIQVDVRYLNFDFAHYL